MAIDHTPFVTPGRGAEMILVVINFIAAVPVFMSERSTFLPILMLDVRAIVVMFLGKGAAAHKACGEGCECQNNVQPFH